MFKKYMYFPKKLSIVLIFNNRKKEIIFDEPSLYDLMIFEDLVFEWKYKEAFKYLKINIKEADFLSNPLEILKSIIKICYWNKKSEDGVEVWEAPFMPSIYDLLAQRYWITPIQLLKEITPSILESYLAGFEYNMNIENWKKEENYKFKEKCKITEEEMKEYDKIMERVNRFDF